jgi:hypothetical protein
MIEYNQLGGDKRLNEIVFAGSHDAGIMYGDGNEKTQGLDIRGQADAGVRIFDLRVAAARHGHKKVELKTYHGGPTKKDVHRPVMGLDDKRDVTRSVMKYGTWGEGLQQILQDARDFVEANRKEFLILKFDKCINWDLIAEMCLGELDGVVYKDGGNVNLKTLTELKGHVIVVFTSKGLADIDPSLHGTGGILGIRNLSEGKSYKPGYQGIQYYGKGGTDMTTAGQGRSINENYRKQHRLMEGGAAGDPDVMGMMYWTTTGVLGSIEDRNKKMWERKHRNEMRELWQEGVGDLVKRRIPLDVDPSDYGGGAVMKRFLPNMVMIDFASPRKCQIIYKLNTMIPTALTDLERSSMEEEEDGRVDLRKARRDTPVGPH